MAFPASLRPKAFVVALAAFAAASLLHRSAPAGIGATELVVPVALPALPVSDQARRSLDGEMAQARSRGAAGFLLVVEPSGKETAPWIAHLSAGAGELGLKLWIGVRFPDAAVATAARALASQPVEGLALMVPPPTGEPTEMGDLTTLFAIKRQGRTLAESIRRIRSSLGPERKLAICVAASETDPETARDFLVPVGDLIRDGTVDVVCLGGAERLNFHRLRLLRDAPLRAGVFLDGSAVEEERRAGLVGRVVLEALQNDTCECLWLAGFPTDLATRLVANTVRQHEQDRAQREALRRAIAAGELVIDQEVRAEACDNQATVHGVGQSFVPSRDGICPLVQINAAIRGCAGPLPPPLTVEIRAAGQGKPGEKVLAQTGIPASQFGHEPTYRWAIAPLRPPVVLKQGVTYWIHLPDAVHPLGSYVWRMASGGATQRGSAWSSRYDYLDHTWAFRVYLKEEPAE